MNLVSACLVLANLLTMIHADCSEFEKQWKICPSDIFPSIPGKNISCSYKIDSSAQVIIIDNKEKVAAVYCMNDIFPDRVFDCLPFKHSKHFVLKDCPFPQTLFDKFFSNSNLNELTVLYPNSHIIQTSLHIHNLPFIQYLSLKNFRTFSYFELILNSVPHMRSIKISNSTFTSLPVKPFQELSQLKGLALTKGVLETLPDDFLVGTNLQSLDLSINRLKNFQPSLIKDMKELKKLNLSHNFLETIDENLFRDAVSLEKINLDHNRINSLPSALFKTSSNIKVLYISHNELREIPDNIFQGLKQMQILSLSHNHLIMLPPNIFNDMSSLMVLELQSNQLHVFPEHLFTSQNRLYQINLSNNKISRFSSTAPFGNNKHLAKVNISNNHLEKFPDLNWSLYNISQLDLSGNSIHEVALPISAKPGGFIFLQYNDIHRLTINKNLNSDYLYFLNGNPFDCNCNLSDFISILSIIADAEILVCQKPWYQTGKYIKDFEKQTELCETINYCPLKCKCHLLLNNQIEVDCSNTGMKSAAISLPFQTTVLHLENNDISSLSDINGNTWKNVTHLYLSNNYLTSLQDWSVPPRLQLLAIDGNKLTKLPSLLMERVSESEDFSIYLKENNWPCDCQTIRLKEWIMKNVPKVKDSLLTYCKPYNNNKLISIAETPSDEFVCAGIKHQIIYKQTSRQTSKQDNSRQTSKPDNSRQISKQDNSRQTSNNCVKLETRVSVSITFCLLLNVAYKMY